MKPHPFSRCRTTLTRSRGNLVSVFTANCIDAKGPIFLPEPVVAPAAAFSLTHLHFLHSPQVTYVLAMKRSLHGLPVLILLGLQVLAKAQDTLDNVAAT